MKLNDAIPGAIFVLIAMIVLFKAGSFPTLPGQPYGPGTFPGIIAAVMLLGGLTLIGSGVKSRTPAIVLSDWIRTPGASGRMAAVVGFVLAYIFLSKPIGFPLLVPVLLTLLLLIMKVRPWVSVVVALVVTGALWLLFARVLMVPLPLGLLTEIVY
jgi:hypothetical protein